jgi:aryl-alcohol dehydrogenase-like predicted oxidoreductase
LEVQQAARAAAVHCQSRGVDIAQLALQYSLQHPLISTTIAGSANPAIVRNWAEWASLPIDQQLLQEVLQILAAVHNVGHQEGLPENNGAVV